MRHINRRWTLLSLLSVALLLILLGCRAHTTPPEETNASSETGVGETIPGATTPDGAPGTVPPDGSLPDSEGESNMVTDASDVTTEAEPPHFEPETDSTGGPVLTPGYVYLYGASELAGVSYEGLVCTEQEVDGTTYMKYRATAADSRVLLVNGTKTGSVQKGRYLCIKYRTGTVKNLAITIGQETLTDKGESTIALEADGQWHAAVVDLFENRCYDDRIDLLRLGYSARGKSLDVEWIAIYPDDGAPYNAYDPLSGLPEVPAGNVDLTGYVQTSGGSASYRADGYKTAEGHTYTFSDGFRMEVYRRRYFNRYTIVYSASSPIRGEITYLLWDDAGKETTYTEAFYLEAGEDRIFASLIDGYFEDVYAYGIAAIELATCKGDEATFTIQDISTNMAPVFASGSYYLENDRFRVGVLLSWGGGISYIEDKQDGDDSLGNLINRADPGRLIQQSYYGVKDGADYEAGMYGETLWRYNPVQGGDLYGNASKLVDFSLSEDGNSIYIKCRPMDWAKNGELTPAYMENTYTLAEDAILVDNRYVDFFHVEHPAHHFELPAFYTISYLGTFHYYNGSKPWTGDAYESLPNESFWAGNSDAYHKIAAGNTETWAAWTANNGFGIGLFTPGAEILLAGRHAYNGSKDPTNNGTSYVAPIQTRAIVPYEPFEYSYIITTGTVDEMRYVFDAYVNPD